MSGEKRKQSLYFPGDMLAEIEAEAQRQQLSLSSVVQLAWRLAKPQLLAMPAPENEGGGA